MKPLLYSLLTLVSLNVYQLKAQSEATFYTNHGNFVVELYDVTMPITAGNFYNLVQAKFYDGVIFHRVINNFMIQGGDPTGTGSGGPGYTIPDEFVTGISNVQKTISMANSGPNTGGSQFFINLVDNTYLDFDKVPLTSAHPVFGITKSNFSVVQAIGAVPVNGSNKPLTDVVMDSIRITKTGPLGLDKVQYAGPDFNIYPNPLLGSSVIEIIAKEHLPLTLTILSQTGSIMASKEIDIKSGKNLIELSEFGMEQWPSGNYYIGFTDQQGTQYKKLVKLN